MEEPWNYALAEHVYRHPTGKITGAPKPTLFEMILNRSLWKVSIIPIDGALAQISVVQE